MAYTEPVPVMNISSVYGLKLQSTTTHWWLSRPDGIWRAPRTNGSPLDLSADIVNLRQRNPGDLKIELENSSGKYSSPGSGDMALLQWRNELRVELGYVTSEGNESSQAGVYWIDSWCWIAREGYSSFLLNCIDAEGLSKRWRVHKQLRWNHEGAAPKSVWEIMKSVLSRFGFCLLNISNRSAAISSFYPQVVISPGETAHSILSSLFSMVPDLIDYQRYSSAYDAIVASTKEPRTTDESCYNYSTRAGEHRILDGTYNETLPLSQARSIGRDTEGETIIDSALNWNLLGRGIDNFQTTYDPELQTTARNQERADTLLRRSSISSEGASISVRVNCGQELYDVVTITDDHCGLEERLCRVVRIEVDYAPRKGVYLQRLLLVRR